MHARTHATLQRYTLARPTAGRLDPCACASPTHRGGRGDVALLARTVHPRVPILAAHEAPLACARWALPPTCPATFSCLPNFSAQLLAAQLCWRPPKSWATWPHRAPTVGSRPETWRTLLGCPLDTFGMVHSPPASPRRGVPHLRLISALTPSPRRRFAWRPLWPSRPRAGRRRRPRALPDPPDASPGPPELRVHPFSCNFHRILLFSARSGHGRPASRRRWSDGPGRGIP